MWTRWYGRVAVRDDERQFFRRFRSHVTQQNRRTTLVAANRGSRARDFRRICELNIQTSRHHRVYQPSRLFAYCLWIHEWGSTLQRRTNGSRPALFSDAFTTDSTGTEIVRVPVPLRRDEQSLRIVHLDSTVPDPGQEQSHALP